MKSSPENYKQYMRSILVGALTGVGLAIMFAAGFFVRDFLEMDSVFAASDPENGEGYQILDEVQTLLNHHYLREQPDYSTRQYAAIRGMLGSLQDRNTFFIEPPVAQSESDVLAGTYGGIGVNLQRNERGEFVLYPFPSSPALAAGIEDGDILTHVNGERIEITDQQDAVDQLLRGEVKDDNGVEITVLQDDEPFTVFILYDVINVPSVLWRVLEEDNRLGYIQVLRFTSRTPDELTESIMSLAAEDIEALILDLRDNSGGLLKESIDVADIFLDGGVVLVEKTNESEREFMAEEGGAGVGFPLVVLVNTSTASASEVVAGAIQDRDRGILIGQNTFGKGTIQQIFTLSDASSVHITSAEWFTPAGNALDGVGLEPDISMIPDENGRDVEMGEAVRYLQEALTG